MAKLSINKAVLAGNLGADPEKRYTPDGKAVTTVRLATSKSYKEGKEWKEHTEWHTVKFFDKLADAAADKLQKGTSIYIEGEIRTRKYKDKETKTDRYVMEIFAHEMKVIDRAKKSAGEDSSSNAGSSRSGNGSNADNDSDGWRNFGASAPENDAPY